MNSSEYSKNKVAQIKKNIVTGLLDIYVINEQKAIDVDAILAEAKATFEAEIADWNEQQ